jgi:hypothetical protein
MITMLQVYDPYEDVLSGERTIDVPLLHLASELAAEFGYADEQELAGAIEDTFEVCCMMNVSITTHFRKVYIYQNGTLKTDWLLSDLATYMLLMNGHATNPKVAQARMYWVHMQTKH